MRSRIPSDVETIAAARQHGLLGPHELPDTRHLMRLKKWLVEAGEQAFVERQAVAVGNDIAAVIATPLKSIHHALVSGDLPMPADAATRVVAALAPQVWRTVITNQKAAQ